MSLGKITGMRRNLMIIDPVTKQPMILGKCRQCGFTGVLRANDVMTSAVGETRSMLVCITCFETPMRCMSENQEHKRLPPEDYAANAAK